MKPALLKPALLRIFAPAASPVVAVLLGITAFTSVAALAPRYDEALKLFHGGKYSESLDVIRAVFDDHRGAVELRLLAAQNYMHLGEYENARAHMTYCLKENNKRLECYATLSSIYRAEKRYDNAIKTARSGIGRVGESVPLRLELASAYYAKANYGASRAHLEKVLQSDPNNFTAIYMDGLIFLKQSKFANAEFRLRHALDIKPKTSIDLLHLYINLGFAIEREGDRLVSAGDRAGGIRRYSEAARHYNYALRIDANHPVARESRERMNTKQVQ